MTLLLNCAHWAVRPCRAAPQLRVAAPTKCSASNTGRRRRRRRRRRLACARAAAAPPTALPPHSAAIARQCSCARALAVWLLAAAGSRADRAHRRAAARAVCAGRRRDDCGAPTRLQLAAHESRGSRRHGSGWHSQCVQRPMAHLSRATHDVPMAQRRATCAVRRSVAQQRNGVTVPTGVRRDRVESARAVAPARPQRERHRPRRAPAVRHVPARQLPDPGKVGQQRTPPHVALSFQSCTCVIVWARPTRSTRRAGGSGRRYWLVQCGSRLGCSTALQRGWGSLRSKRVQLCWLTERMPEGRARAMARPCNAVMPQRGGMGRRSTCRGTRSMRSTSRRSCGRRRRATVCRRSDARRRPTLLSGAVGSASALADGSSCHAPATPPGQGYTTQPG